MSPDWVTAHGTDNHFQVLWKDGERALCRGQWGEGSQARRSVLAVRLTAERPGRASLDRLNHEYRLKNDLDGAWAVCPLELVRDGDRPMLLLEDPGGEPLEGLLGQALEVGRFLRVTIGIADALGRLHQRGLVHKDLTPAHIMMEASNEQVRLTGLGIASRLPRERQAPTPPEFIAGTLAYMAPEQTGRVNRSIDSRSDLYALGIICYRMLTGSLPFAASDPMEWVHCHIARTPLPPSERIPTTPATISAIIMKLLAKTAEERYQTAGGVEHDLRRCLVEWDARGRVDAFELGARDVPDRLLIPEKLYGRTREVRTLLDSFEGMLAGGAPELVLVSGYPGIGKSSVVNELHKVLVPPRGLFASGKFDQYKRDIPYATFAQAFQGLVDQLLSKSESELGQWREALRETLGPNGALMIDLIPELKLVIGEQPPVTELPPQDARRRFHVVFRRFIGVFACSEHPLALFLDDLQWLDAATLDLLEDLLVQPDIHHLLLIGAYRDNEVTSAHPLMRKLETIRNAGARVHEIVLAPLGPEDLASLVDDALHCDRGDAVGLVELVLEKTAGNPFFVIQFLSALAEEGLLTFEDAKRRWTWDLARIDAHGYTDNVVDLMIDKLGRMPVDTQRTLRLLACMGIGAPSRLLAIVRDESEEALRGDLHEALVSGLVLRAEGSYRFLHDRVQEAAYSLIPDGQRAAAHLRIGHLLVTHTPPENREDAIFEIVNQLNRGVDLMSSRAERERLAGFNLTAGKRAMAATAYVSALRYLVAGAALLSEDRWQCRPDLAFPLELHQTECQFLTGDVAAAEARLTRLASRAVSLVDRAAVATLGIDLHMTLGRSDRAIEACLSYLRHLGIEWTPHPAEEEARREFERISSLLAQRDLRSLADSALMLDPESVGTMNVLTVSLTSALYTDSNLLCLLTCRMVDLTLAYGNSDGSCLAFAWMGRITGSFFGNQRDGFRLGQLGRDMVELPGLGRFKARAYINFANYSMPWGRHVREGQDLLRRAHDVARSTGDAPHGAFSLNNLITNLLSLAEPLADVQIEAERGLAFAHTTGFDGVVRLISMQLALVRTLRGLTPAFGCLDHADFDETGFEAVLSSTPAAAGVPIAAFRYWTRKLQARLLAGDIEAAVQASRNAEHLLWTMPPVMEVAEAHLYGALSHAASCDAALPARREQHIGALRVHHRQLAAWAESCPDNFQNRAALVGAEIARVEGRELDAARLYDEAIRLARANGFVHVEALTYELAARFYAATGLQEIAEMHLLRACNGYLRWGADGKVRQLEALHPHLRNEVRTGPTGTISTAVENLELATVVNVSRAISGEIVLDRLLETLMRTAIQQAGAQRGLLIVPDGDRLRIEAQAMVDGDSVVVQLRDEPVTETAVPRSVLLYVLRTLETVHVDDAAAQAPFGADPYILEHHARSMFCLPLVAQGKLSGVLYLENNLAPGVFLPRRTAVLTLLASQAAIALENARLYRDVAEREARIRRLVDANIIGTFIWKVSGEGPDLDAVLVEANDAFLQMVGYDRPDIAAGRLTKQLLTPPDSREHVARTFAEVQRTGSVLPLEKEYVRRDGSRVPVLLGIAAFDERGLEGFAFVIDLSDSKRAEADALENERRCRDLQASLAHASRVTTMGQLTASIAHEVSQPVSAAITNANTALRWLKAERPNVAEAVDALELTVRDGRRAREVVDRVRALARKAPAREDLVEVNAAVREVIDLVDGETAKNRVAVHLALEEGLPPVRADRVQIQQVVLNLVLNAIESMNDVAKGARELWISSARTDPDSVLVSVRDSGVGLEPERLTRVFDPFYSTKAEGLGMGLAICRSIVEAHGGRLWATADVPRGAIFQFTLPADRPAS